ncbi:LuxR C-terminal-related transcriptional regulator [Pontibacter toksunensis]|uniref:LuxR C-terminal-related transcriptional regulator n=1 Tax=Pontibacter toksunensis TaxID=1332631 RepID=A0ABW6BVP5_9BACT
MQLKSDITLEQVTKDNFPGDYEALVKVWQNQCYGPVSTNYSQSLLHHPEFLAILNQSPCVTSILDLRTQQFDFISSNVEAILGYASCRFVQGGLAFYNTVVHPDDLQNTWKLRRTIWEFILTLPAADQVQFKFNYDYRIIKPCGKEVRVFAQNSVLQSDNRGNITHIMAVYSDISHWKKSEQQLASIVSNAKDTCLFFSTEGNEPCHTPSSLSKRELEIVKLMAEGYSSKIIADKLFISFHTVNTHRQKIMEKTKTKNTGGLVQFVISHGLI